MDRCVTQFLFKESIFTKKSFEIHFFVPQSAICNERTEGKGRKLEGILLHFPLKDCKLKD